MQDVINQPFQGSEERNRQAQEVIEKVEAARMWVEKIELNARTKVKELEKSFPDLLARRALGEASSDEVAECRTRIARLRESVGECNLARGALERRLDDAHSELTLIKHHQNNSGKKDPDPDKTLAATNKEADGRVTSEREAENSLMTAEQLKSECKRRGISINSFSKSAVMSQSFVSRVIRGEKKMSKALSDKAREILVM